MMTNNLALRAIQKNDCKTISESFEEQGWDKPTSQYEKYVEYQEEGKRDVIIEELEGEFVGYVTIIWKPEYPLFKEKRIPEIADFNVLKKHQRRGFGTLMMDEAERRIKKVSDSAGIGFGVYKDYGAAQILYINRGYIPDGNGLVKDLKPLKYGEKVIIDDSIILYLTKDLKACNYQ